MCNVNYSYHFVHCIPELSQWPSGKESACNAAVAGDAGFIWVRKIPWRRASHSSILSWRIPWTEESGRLQSIGSQRVRHYLK